jgi:hypothetical protein
MSRCRHTLPADVLCVWPLLDQLNVRATALRRQHGRACADRRADPALCVQVIDQLGVRPTAPQRPGAPAPAGPPRRQFILPLEDPACETSINNILTGVTLHTCALLAPGCGPCSVVCVCVCVCVCVRARACACACACVCAGTACWCFSG